MKQSKLIKIFLFITLTISLLACQKAEKQDSNPSPGQDDQVKFVLDRVEGIEEIDYDSLQEKLNTPVDFLLYIGRPDCGDCQLFEPYLENYIQEHPGSGIYYLNIKSFRDASKKEDASQEEVDFYENLREYLDFSWTPTLAHYQNGKKVDGYEFLDASFGRIPDGESNQEKEKLLQSYVESFEAWMEENL